MLNKLFKVAQSIQQQSGSNDKIKVLLDYKDDSVVKNYLKYLLDPDAVYGIQKKKLLPILKQVKEGAFSECEIENILSMYFYLISCNTGRDQDVRLLANFIVSQNKEDNPEIEQFLIESFTKQLKLGVTANSANKAFGKDFIPQHKVMRAKDYNKESHKIKPNDELIITEKLDGVRLTAFYDQEGLTFKLRSGKVIVGLEELESQVRLLPYGVYEGEVIVDNFEELSNMDAYRKTTSIIRTDGVKKGLVYGLFDYIDSVKIFKEEKKTTTFKERRQQLEDIVQQHTKEAPLVFAVKKLAEIKGNELELIDYHFDQMIEQRREGVIVNYANKTYAYTKTDAILKIKEEDSIDLIVEEVYEGENKYTGKLGGLIVNYKGSELRVGGGISDEQREQWWNEPNLIVGQLIEITHSGESKNNQGGLSVRFPRLKTVRTDKVEISYD